MNKIATNQGPIYPPVAALFHFPEIFQQRKDQYLEAFIRSVFEDTETNSTEIRQADAYIGNIHVSPVSRLWNTNKTRKDSKMKPNSLV